MDGVNRMYGPDYSGTQTGEMWELLGYIVVVGLIGHIHLRTTTRLEI